MYWTIAALQRKGGKSKGHSGGEIIGKDSESEFEAHEREQEELAATEDFDGAHEASIKAEKVQASMRERDDLLLKLTQESEDYGPGVSERKKRNSITATE